MDGSWSKIHIVAAGTCRIRDGEIRATASRDEGRRDWISTRREENEGSEWTATGEVSLFFLFLVPLVSGKWSRLNWAPTNYSGNEYELLEGTGSTHRNQGTGLTG